MIRIILAAAIFALATAGALAGGLFSGVVPDLPKITSTLPTIAPIDPGGTIKIDPTKPDLDTVLKDIFNGNETHMGGDDPEGGPQIPPPDCTAHPDDPDCEGELLPLDVTVAPKLNLGLL